jgi:seryl-tRNA synthetase
MIDIQFIRDNPDLVAEKSAQKGYPVDVPHLLDLDKRRRELLGRVEELRAQRNIVADAAKGTRPTDTQIAEGRRLKTEVALLEEELEPVDHEYQEMLRAVPNMPLAYVPVGASEDENVVVRTVGSPKEYDFTPRHDYQLGELHDLIDKERATKIAGARFAYLKGDLVRLQFALIQYVMQKLGDEPFIEKLVKELKHQH